MNHEAVNMPLPGRPDIDEAFFADDDDDEDDRFEDDDADFFGPDPEDTPPPRLRRPRFSPTTTIKRIQ